MDVALGALCVHGPRAAALSNRANAPRSDCASELRIENTCVHRGATSIMPTAIGRTMLYQSV